MYKNQFLTSSRNGTIPRAVMLFGECEHSATQCEKLALKSAGKDAQITKMYFDEYSSAEAVKLLKDRGLFATVNALIIRQDKKIPPKELTILLEAVKNNSSSYLIYHAKADHGRDLSRTFSAKNGADFVRFFKPNAQEGTEELEKYARENQLLIDRYALSQLLEMHDNNILCAINDLKKFQSNGEHIGIKEITSISSGLSGADFETLTKLLINKRPFAAELARLLNDFDDIRFISSLTASFSQLFMFVLSGKINGHMNSQEILGYALPKLIEREKQNLCTRISVDKYPRIISCLNSCEYELKSSSGKDARSEIASTLLRIERLM